MERTWTCTKFSNAASGNVFGMSWIVSLEPSDVERRQGDARQSDAFRLDMAFQGGRKNSRCAVRILFVGEGGDVCNAQMTAFPLQTDGLGGIRREIDADAFRRASVDGLKVWQ